MNAQEVVNDLLETDEQRQLGEFLEVLSPFAQQAIMAGLNSTMGSSGLAKHFKSILFPFKRKLDRLGMDCDFFAYLLVALRNRLIPALGSDEFGQALASQMARFTAHIQPLEVERPISATDIFGPYSQN